MTKLKARRQTLGAKAENTDAQAVPAEHRVARRALFGMNSRRIVLATGFLLGLEPNLYPATRTWDGGGSDSNITTGLNWVGDTAPGSGDSLYFAGSLRLTPLLNSNLSVNRLTFNSGAGAFVLGGTGIYTINRNGITNSSTNTQTIGNAIALSRNQSWKATSGDLVITGAVNTSGRRITFNGGKNSTLTNVVRAQVASRKAVSAHSRSVAATPTVEPPR